jgi:hypothetical protein
MLSRSKLSGDLARIFGSPDRISGRSSAESLWTNAYHSYASDAEDISGDGVLTVNKTAFLSILDFGREKTPSEAAHNFDQAFVAYWTGAIFSVGILIVTPPLECPNAGGNGVWSSETTSVVDSVAPNVLAPLLVPIFSGLNEGDTAVSKASQFARAFHTATTTAVSVLITGLDTTPGPTGPLSISNTCTIR